MQRITTFLKRMGWVGFVFLFTCLCVTSMQAQVNFLWTQELMPRDYVYPTGMATFQNSSVVVGYCKDELSNARSYAFAGKVSNSGETLFLRQFSGGSNVVFDNLALGGNGHIYAGGQLDNTTGTSRNGVIIALDTNGDSLWSYVIQQDDDRTPDVKSLVYTSAGEIATIGTHINPVFFAKSAIVIFLNDDGTENRRFIIGEDYGQFIEIKDFFERPDGNFTIIGQIQRLREPLLEETFFALCVSSTGDSLWSQVYHIANQRIEIKSVANTLGGAFSIGARAWDGEQGPIVISCNVDGDTLWTNKLRSTTRFTDGTFISYAEYDSCLYALFTEDVWPGGPLERQVIAKIAPTGEVIAETGLYAGIDTSFASAFCIMPDTTIRTTGQLEYTNSEPGYVFAFDDVLFLDADNRISSLKDFDINLSAFPNPFNSTTKFTFDIPRTARTSLKVYDVLGREVETLLDDVCTKRNTNTVVEPRRNHQRNLLRPPAIRRCGPDQPKSR